MGGLKSGDMALTALCWGNLAQEWIAGIAGLDVRPDGRSWPVGGAYSPQERSEGKTIFGPPKDLIAQRLRYRRRSVEGVPVVRRRAAPRSG